MNNNLRITPLVAKTELLLWTVYILVAIYGAWHFYQLSPEDYFNPQIHEITSSHKDDNGKTIIDSWQDEKTGTDYYREDYTQSIREQRWMLPYFTFLYGLVGALFYAGMQGLRKRKYFKPLVKAMLLNIGISVIVYIIVSQANTIKT